MNPFPKFSIIIPTLNRASVVAKLADQLLSQNYPDFEIIIIDQSLKQNDELFKASQGQPDKVRYFRITQAGVCQAKNYGIDKARGELFLFIDDDSEVDDVELLPKHAKNYQDAEISGVGGRIEDVNKKLNKEDSGPVCWVDKTGKIFSNATGTERVDINAPRGGHVSYRASAARAIKGFDENFVGNAMREETDFSLRIIKKTGKKIVFDPSVTITHLGLSSGGSRETSRRQWYEDFFANEYYFFRKHFSARYLPRFFLRKSRAILSCMFYYGRGRWSWLKTPIVGFGKGCRKYQALSSEKNV
ncbi:MAG: glycosyltransferase family 2 protein [bacterium]